MKATGIVRRIDDLGRIVIPKEIRRTMRIREGDPLEIYTSPDGEVIFKKYSPVGEISCTASQYADVLSKVGGCPAVICDRDHVIAVSGRRRSSSAAFQAPWRTSSSSARAMSTAPARISGSTPSRVSTATR